MKKNRQPDGENLSVIKSAGFKAVKKDKKDKSVNRRAGLHDRQKDLQGEKRIYKRRPLALKHVRRMRKAAVALSAVFVAAVSYVGYGFLKTTAPVDLTANYETVCYELPADGTSPISHSAVECVGYMNYKLKSQKTWSSEFHSTVNAMGLMNQDVSTYKSFYDGVLVSADITTSSMINNARQFCVANGRVLWREAAGGKTTYNGLDTPWKDVLVKGGNLTLDEFKAQRGFPPTEFSVYVINEKTVLEEGTDVAPKDTGDGTYSVTLHLNSVSPVSDSAENAESINETSAIYYYQQQMKVTGGINGAVFNDLRVTYKFDADYRVLETKVYESYNAEMGISANCSSNSLTVYTYEETAKDAEENVDKYYDGFFKNQMGTITVGDGGAEINTAECLAKAFGSVLTDGAIFKLDLQAEDLALDGVVSLNSDFSDIRVRLGDILVYFGNYDNKKSLYLSSGGAKYKLCLDDLSKATENGDGENSSGDLLSGLDVNSLLEQLGSGELITEENKATLQTQIDLSSLLSSLGLSVGELKIDLKFSFNLNDGGEITLDYVSAEIPFEGKVIKARLAFGTETDVPQALTDETRAQYIDLLNGEISLAVKLNVDDFTLNGGVKIALENGKLKGVSADFAQDGISVWYVAEENALYIALGEEKYKLGLNSIGTSAMSADSALAGFDLGAILKEVLANLTFNENGLGTSLNLTLGEQNIPVSLGLKIKNGIAVNLGLTALDKNVTAEVALGEAEVAPLTDKDDFIDLLNGEITFGVKLNVDGNELNGAVAIKTVDGALDNVILNVAGAGLGVYFDLNDGALYVSAENTAKIKIPVSAFSGGNGDAFANFDFNALVSQALSNLAFGTDGISSAITLGLFDENLPVSAALTIKNGISAAVDLTAFGKSVSVDAKLGGSVTELTEEEKAAYVDVLSDGISLNGKLQLTTGSTSIDLILNGLSVSFNDGFALELDARLTTGSYSEEEVEGETVEVYNAGYYFDIRVKYAKGAATLVYGNQDGYFGVEIDTANDITVLKNCVTDVLNRIQDVFGEIIDNYEDAVTLENLKNIITSLTAGLSAAEGTESITGLFGDGKFDSAQILGMFGIPVTENGGVDIARLLTDLVITQNDGYLTLKLGENLAIGIGDGLEGNLKVTFGDSTVALELSSIKVTGTAAALGIDDFKLLNVDDLTDMLDYLACTVELLTEKEYSLNASTTVFTDLNDGKAAPLYDVNIIFEYIQGESGFPVDVSLPVIDAEGNTVSGLKLGFHNDMYWHFNVNLVNYEEGKDDLYLDIYILDANPLTDEKGKTTGLDTSSQSAKDALELDVYMSVSKYAPYVCDENNNPVTNASYNPLKIYAPVKDILTVISAGIALLNVDEIDVSGIAEGAEKIQSVITALTDVLYSAFVYEYLPDTYGQFAALGQSLLPQFIGGDLNTLLNGILGQLIAGGQNADEQPENQPEEPRTGDPVYKDGNFIKKFDISTVEEGFAHAGDKQLSIVLNSAAIYGDASYDDLTFNAYKMNVVQSQDVTKSYITGADISNIYFGGDKRVDINLGVTREVEKLSDFNGYVNFSGVDTLLQSIVNSATHTRDKADAVDFAQYESEEKMPEYLLNHDYYISGKITLTALGYDIPVTVQGLSAHIDADNDVTINAKLFIPKVQMALGMITVINDDTFVDLTIKDGMFYAKRTVGKNVEYRVMTLTQFTDDLMGQIFYLFNMSSVLSSLVDTFAGGGNSGSDEPKVTFDDFGDYIGKILSIYTFAQHEDSANWTIAVVDETITALAGVELKGLKVDLGANKSSLNGALNISTLGIQGALAGMVDFKGSLTYLNPQYNWVDGKDVSKTTVDLATASISELGGLSWTQILTGKTYEEIKAEITEENKAIKEYNSTLAEGQTGKAAVTLFDKIKAYTKWQTVTEYLKTYKALGENGDMGGYLRFGSSVNLAVGDIKYLIERVVNNKIVLEEFMPAQKALYYGQTAYTVHVSEAAELDAVAAEKYSDIEGKYDAVSYSVSGSIIKYQYSYNSSAFPRVEVKYVGNANVEGFVEENGRYVQSVGFIENLASELDPLDNANAYIFGGFYSDAQLTAPVTEIIATSGLEVFVKWIPKEVQVTYISDVNFNEKTASYRQDGKTYYAINAVEGAENFDTLSLKNGATVAAGNSMFFGWYAELNGSYVYAGNTQKLKDVILSGEHQSEQIICVTVYAVWLADFEVVTTNVSQSGDKKWNFVSEFSVIYEGEISNAIVAETDVVSRFTVNTEYYLDGEGKGTFNFSYSKRTDTIGKKTTVTGSYQIGNGNMDSYYFYNYRNTSGATKADLYFFDGNGNKVFVGSKTSAYLPV